VFYNSSWPNILTLLSYCEATIVWESSIAEQIDDAEPDLFEIWNIV